MASGSGSRSPAGWRSEPKVLLADEPVSMLDVSIRLGVLNLLADLRDRERLAILYVTHDIASARYLADTIMVMYAGKVVEAGPADEITNDPAHPYTQLLLSAAPDPYTDEKPWLGAAGAPPSLVNPPSGCRFHPRCPHAMPICSAQQPPTFPVDGRHAAACWLHTTEPLEPGHVRATELLPAANPSREWRKHMTSIRAHRPARPPLAPQEDGLPSRGMPVIDTQSPVSPLRPRAPDRSRPRETPLPCVAM